LRSSLVHRAPPPRSSADSSPTSTAPPFNFSAIIPLLCSSVRVKSLILTNPSNPLGTVLDRDTLANLLRFADQHRIHLVCDEIYSATISGLPAFVSITGVLEEHPNICDRDLVDIVYNLSKVLGLPGFRVSIVYSYNDELVLYNQQMSSFWLVSSQTQCLLMSMLSDEEFMDAFMKESTRRLAERRMAFTAGLAKVGIRCLEGANVGLLLWTNLRPLLEEGTVDEETKLWRAIMEEVKLNLSLGSSFHCA
ncbi:hypothetical protein Taro_021534, partial [Colocasia esculenta]|nr:hypothetical protein [Colocasia esculenta]